VYQKFATSSPQSQTGCLGEWRSLPVLEESFIRATVSGFRICTLLSFPPASSMHWAVTSIANRTGVPLGGLVPSPSQMATVRSISLLLKL